ncbi:DUF1573 domain-containing protein [Enhygromyxa salina]|uniref:DUF1573 domain-containing protein n=1 Tax=Enhygromyxa salina TaxID=215803 RepID=A0A2S9YIQ1_9BACT|nr:DUF1573 domain-containing protein [Enhygromyxa salina]PRQ04983.1 hypothetical protein ENSA7_49160 [Enhygromyxa salina]
MSKPAKPLCALSLVTSLMLLACGTQSPAPAPAAQAEVQANADASTDTDTGAAEQQGAPKIASDEATYDFGAIKPVDSIEHVFKIKNEGTADLHIERVQKT